MTGHHNLGQFSASRSPTGMLFGGQKNSENRDETYREIAHGNCTHTVTRVWDPSVSLILIFRPGQIWIFCCQSFIDSKHEKSESVESNISINL